MIFTLILIFIWSLGSYINLRLLGYSSNSPWWTLFTFNLAHISFIHLAINISIFMFYWRGMDIINKKILIPVLILVPAISAFLSATTVPTIGLSAMVYCLLGITMCTLDYRIQNWAIIIFSFVFTYIFAPHINTLIHVYSYLISYAVGRFAGRWLYD